MKSGINDGVSANEIFSALDWIMAEVMVKGGVCYFPHRPYQVVEYLQPGMWYAKYYGG